jgi:subtilase family serine protease
VQRIGHRRGLAVLAAGALTLSLFAPASQAGAKVVLTAKTTTSAAASAPTKQHQIKVLTAALQYMQTNFAQFSDATPGPRDLFDYQIGNLWKQGIDGYGTTIAVMEGWDSPGIARQVAQFDKFFHLPNPEIQTVFPDGPLPAKCPRGMVKLGGYGSCSAWQGELALDVLTAHFIAPYANIVISATPADSEINSDTAEQVAMPEIMKGVEYVSQNHLANVISISDGTGESTYPYGPDEITAQNAAELTAAAAGIPVSVGTGDCGVVQNLAVANGQCEDVSQGPDTAAWDDSPWITAVGGTVPNINSSGQKVGPDPIWHVGGVFGEGAGYSAIYARPAYQDDVAGITHSSMRSVPDITMDASDGTSESAPMFAGVLDLATQLNHDRNVGPVNPALYGILGPGGVRDGIADVVKGNNSEVVNGKVVVPGFAAGKGFDVASGWGTVNAATFVPSLVAATRAMHQEAAARQQAVSSLRQIEDGIQLSSTKIGSGKSSYLLDQGFLPTYPVQLSIDGNLITTLTATTSGYVTYMINPQQLGLAAGHHVLQLTSMLVTATASFTSG